LAGAIAADALAVKAGRLQIQQLRNDGQQYRTADPPSDRDMRIRASDIRSGQRANAVGRDKRRVAGKHVVGEEAAKIAPTHALTIKC
jgi:hypothetical protein